MHPSPQPQTPIRYLSVCSGIEAATVAWEPLGWTPVGFSEIESFPAAVLAHHYPSTPNFGDLTKHETWPLTLGSIDLLVGGTPCQSFSVAGLRKGLADPRGNLMLSYLAVADRLRPKWVVWENVPGVLSSNGGRDFGTFLGALGELGYGWAYRVLDAQWCRTHGHPRAVPQRRRRVFVVGCLGDATSAAAVLFERESVRRNPAKGAKAREVATADARSGANGGMFWNGEQVTQTLDAVLAKQQTMPEKNHFPAVLVPTPRPIVIDRAAFNQGQNAQYGSAIGESDTMSTLIARGPHAVAYPLQDGRELDKRQNGLGIGNANDPAYTVDCTGAQAVAFEPGIAAREGNPSRFLVEIAPTLRRNCGDNRPAVAFVKAKRAQSADDDETWQTDRPAPTLSVFDSGDTRACVAIVLPEPAPTLAIPIQDGRELDKRQKGLGIGGEGDPSYTLDTTGAASVAHTIVSVQPRPSPKALAVRRLTPRECERLQGFPDDYTAVPHRGKPAADGPRYKALGNSMAVNCMEWIGERIAAVNARIR